MGTPAVSVCLLPQHVVEGLGQFVFGTPAGQLPHRLFPTVENEQMGNATNVKFVGQLEVFGHVHFADFHAPGEPPGEAVDDWRQPVARASTRSPEIDQDRPIAVNDFLDPVIDAQFQDIGHVAFPFSARPKRPLGMTGRGRSRRVDGKFILPKRG